MVRGYDVLYSRTLSQVKTFTNFAVLPPSAKVFFHEFCACIYTRSRTQPTFLIGNPQTFSPRNAVFFQFAKVFTCEVVVWPMSSVCCVGILDTLGTYTLSYVAAVRYKLNEDPKLLTTGQLPENGATIVALAPNSKVVAVAINSSLFIYSSSSGEMMEKLIDVHGGTHFFMGEKNCLGCCCIVLYCIALLSRCLSCIKCCSMYVCMYVCMCPLSAI